MDGAPIAGHETISIALAWAFERLAHHPQVVDRALVVGLGVVLVGQSISRWLALLHPVATFAVMTVTANHFWGDSVTAGAADPSPWPPPPGRAGPGREGRWAPRPVGPTSRADTTVIGAKQTPGLEPTTAPREADHDPEHVQRRGCHAVGPRVPVGIRWHTQAADQRRSRLAPGWCTSTG